MIAMMTVTMMMRMIKRAIKILQNKNNRPKR